MTTINADLYRLTVLPVVPMREDTSDKSQMVSQLLFGEMVEIVEIREKWLLVRSREDGYLGWVDRRMMYNEGIADYDALFRASRYRVVTPLATICSLDTGDVYNLPMGSLLPGFQITTREFKIGSHWYLLTGGDVAIPMYESPRNVLKTAHLLKNTPYLWGGRTALGIDCSAFAQLVYRLQGISLPRDAAEQVKSGNVLTGSETPAPGDLAFFYNSTGGIGHVGIVNTPSTIIHASSSVRVDRLDKTGIYREDIKEYTHQLSCIVRLR